MTDGWPCRGWKMGSQWPVFLWAPGTFHLKLSDPSSNASLMTKIWWSPKDDRMGPGWFFAIFHLDVVITSSEAQSEQALVTDLVTEYGISIYQHIHVSTVNFAYLSKVCCWIEIITNSFMFYYSLGTGRRPKGIQWLLDSYLICPLTLSSGLELLGTTICVFNEIN